MVPFDSKPRFKVNPIEIAIFAAISLIFVKSGYSLLYSHEGLDPVALTASAQDPMAPVSNRAPASAGPTDTSNTQKIFSEVKIGCEKQDETSVSANKIRLIGSFCAGDGEKITEISSDDVKKINVVNTSAKVAATVFPDYTNKKFSTDYISLSPGKNLIYVEYELKDGRTFARQFGVTKN